MPGRQEVLQKLLLLLRNIAYGRNAQNPARFWQKAALKEGAISHSMNNAGPWAVEEGWCSLGAGILALCPQVHLLLPPTG